LASVCLEESYTEKSRIVCFEERRIACIIERRFMCVEDAKVCYSANAVACALAGCAKIPSLCFTSKRSGMCVGRVCQES